MNPTLAELLDLLQGDQGRFGVLAESNTHQLTVIAQNTDVSVGDLFLLPTNGDLTDFISSEPPNTPTSLIVPLTSGMSPETNSQCRTPTCPETWRKKT